MSIERKMRRAEKQRRTKQERAGDQREDVVLDTAAVFTCAHETAADFNYQCSRARENLEADIAFNDVAHEIWREHQGRAQDLAKALESLVLERKRHAAALAELQRRFTELAADESWHEHLEPIEKYRDLVRQRIFAEPPSTP